MQNAFDILISLQFVICTECARDRGPYEVKNASQETQMHAGRVKYAVLETPISASRWDWALNFGEFSGSNSIKKH